MLLNKKKITKNTFGENLCSREKRFFRVLFQIPKYYISKKEMVVIIDDH